MTVLLLALMLLGQGIPALPGQSGTVLLPDNYDLEISIFDHFTLNQPVVIGDDDVNLDLTARRVN